MITRSVTNQLRGLSERDTGLRSPLPVPVDWATRELIGILGGSGRRKWASWSTRDNLKQSREWLTKQVASAESRVLAGAAADSTLKTSAPWCDSVVAPQANTVGNGNTAARR